MNIKLFISAVVLLIVGCNSDLNFKEGVYDVHVSEISNTCSDKEYASEITWVVELCPADSTQFYCYAAYNNSLLLYGGNIVLSCSGDGCDEYTFKDADSGGRVSVTLTGSGRIGEFDAVRTIKYTCDVVACITETIGGNQPEHCEKKYSLHGKWVSAR